MPYYENVFIVRPDVPSAYREQIIHELSTLVDDRGGSVAKHEYWGLRNLTYPIRKNSQGHYFLFQLDAPAEAVAEMESRMHRLDEVIRYQTLKIKQLDQEPSILMRTKAEYGDDSHGERNGRQRSDERQSSQSSYPPTHRRQDQL